MTQLDTVFGPDSHYGWRPADSRFLDILDEPFYRLLADLQDLVLVESSAFWKKRNAKFLNLPITTDTISSPMGRGSDSVPVSVDMFGVKTYLADSMQFMLEYGCRLNGAGAWYIMPSFRGEDADPTHLNQFFHSEAEIPGGLTDVMTLVDAYVRHLTGAAVNEFGSRIAEVAGGLGHVDAVIGADRYPRITFDEAVSLLDDQPRFVRHEDGWRTLTRAGEQELLRTVHPVLWVSHYDHLSVPFYQAYAGDSTRTALNADLLFGIGEVVGCGERHMNGEEALRALEHHEVSPASYDWYLRMKRARPMRTAGFGLGIERWLMWLLRSDDIRELQLVPRLNGIALQP
ncbi:amino acid--tRNA ligase-related protein [Streptosporangium roseum]|uniref:Asparaginase like protein 1-like protein n=1 Tax=Streptosporangium roseum (strain ATCC 12428 / DSM 43021 / JCM 3005 / KCTC 9067 / NCIMB 10171 / NRRL 2505 / NI 9100) TaxID=479432 RepID=D2AZV4_STRRD|nr:amino acid--tRNA ligase-related protein [Streptosporangium roseum]ACZ87188.1 asparaginase like protein 1-like protein [Streptosporangium roseum DSM 43021]